MKLKLTIKLSRKNLWAHEAENCIHDFKLRTVKCFRLLKRRSRQKVRPQFRPVANMPPLGRIFNIVTDSDYIDLFEAIVRVYCKFVAELWEKQKPGLLLAEYLFNEEAVRIVWPNLDLLKKRLAKEQKRVEKFVGNYRERYQILELSLTSSRQKPFTASADGGPSPNDQGELYKVVSGEEESKTGEDPGRESPVIFRPEKKPFKAYLHKLGCRPGTPSEIIFDPCKTDQPLRLYLDRKSEQTVKENPEYYSKRLLRFKYHPDRDYVVSIEVNVTTGDVS